MRADPVNYRAGDVVQFHQNAGGPFRKGTRFEVRGHDAEGRVLIARPGEEPAVLPLQQARHFDVYEKRELHLAVGDHLRITQNGMSADKKHRLINGTLHKVAGFNHRGDILLDNGQAVAKDYGHLAHGYCTTSHSSQGKTVDRVLIAVGPESFPAASQEQFYVSVSRGREACTIYCEDKHELLEAVRRSGERMSATELTDPGYAGGFAEARGQQPKAAAGGRDRVADRVAGNGEIYRQQERARQYREAAAGREREVRQAPQIEPKRGRGIER